MTRKYVVPFRNFTEISLITVCLFSEMSFGSKALMICAQHNAVPQVCHILYFTYNLLNLPSSLEDEDECLLALNAETGDLISGKRGLRCQNFRDVSVGNQPNGPTGLFTNMEGMLDQMVLC
jgi:hypothetical protein